MTNRQLPRLATLSPLTLALLLVAGGLLARPVCAQSESDLRKQNQELTTKVKDLEAELAAARRKADDLQKRVTALESALAARPSSGGGKVILPLEEGQVSIDESKPGASPRALRKAIEESYQKAVANLPMGKKGDKDRIVYMRALEKWAPATEREYRMPITWHVRVDSSPDARHDMKLRFVAFDPVTGTQLGDPFDATLSRAVAARLSELESRGDLDLLELKGTVIPEIRINLERESRGAFDNPLFAGPFAEWGFVVDPSGVAPFKPAATQPAATKPAAGTKAPAAPATPAPTPEK